MVGNDADDQAGKDFAGQASRWLYSFIDSEKSESNNMQGWQQLVSSDISNGIRISDTTAAEEELRRNQTSIRSQHITLGILRSGRKKHPGVYQWGIPGFGKMRSRDLLETIVAQQAETLGPDGYPRSTWKFWEKKVPLVTEP